MNKILLINVITVIIFVVLYLVISLIIIPPQHFITLTSSNLTFENKLIFTVLAPFSYFEILGSNKYTFFINSIWVFILMTILFFINTFKIDKTGLFPFRIFISGIIATIIVCTVIGIIWSLYKLKNNRTKIDKILLDLFIIAFIIYFFSFFTTPSYKSNVIHFFGLIVSTIVYFALEKPVNKLYEMLGGENGCNNKVVLTK